MVSTQVSFRKETTKEIENIQNSNRCGNSSI